MSIIRNALTLTLPVIIAGAAAVLVNNFPVPAYQRFMSGLFGENWRTFGGFIWNGTLAVLSPVMTFSIGYSIAERHNLKNPVDAVHPVISGLLSFCCLLLLTESSASDWAIPYNWMTVNGLFAAILAAFLSAELLLWFCRFPRLRIRFFSEEAGASMTHVFAAAPEKYSLIFMDVQMPRMDGLEASRRIRAMDNTWAVSIPIIAMTANVFREDIERCLAAGMNDHLGKPLDINEVMAKLRKYLPKKE